MHAEDAEFLPTLCLARFSAVADGMHVEVSAPPHARESARPFITFREDEQLGKQVILHSSAQDVSFPLSELRRAIAFAEMEVHKESFYD